jgi:hypothetical protein
MDDFPEFQPVISQTQPVSLSVFIVYAMHFIRTYVISGNCIKFKRFHDNFQLIFNILWTTSNVCRSLFIYFILFFIVGAIQMSATLLHLYFTVMTNVNNLAIGVAA